jgi:hypothetical protein
VAGDAIATAAMAMRTMNSERRRTAGIREGNGTLQSIGF